MPSSDSRRSPRRPCIHDRAVARRLCNAAMSCSGSDRSRGGASNTKKRAPTARMAETIGRRVDRSVRTSDVVSGSGVAAMQSSSGAASSTVSILTAWCLRRQRRANHRIAGAVGARVARVGEPTKRSIDVGPLRTPGEADQEACAAAQSGPELTGYSVQVELSDPLQLPHSSPWAVIRCRMACTRSGNRA